MKRGTITVFFHIITFRDAITDKKTKQFTDSFLLIEGIYGDKINFIRKQVSYLHVYSLLGYTGVEWILSFID